MIDAPQIKVEGHLHVQDDDGNVLVDKDNAIHPQNMARVIARGLANEYNSYIWRLAFGNGGTEITAANQIEYRTPNDGQPPDLNTWNSRLYNEVYSEIVDDGRDVLNPDIGTDPGSSDFNGARPGGGAVPERDPTTVPHVSGPGVRSNELGLTSEVVITCVLNQEEPLGQYDDDIFGGVNPFESSFVFDEIGLYSGGATAGSVNGYQNVDVGNKKSTNSTPLLASRYGFTMQVDDGTPQTIIFEIPAGSGSASDGSITYGDLCEALNTTDPTWNFTSSLPGLSQVLISDEGDGSYPTTNGAETYGYLQFKSLTSSSTSSVVLGAYTDANTTDLFAALSGQILSSVPGQDAGIQNDPVNELFERERLLSHVIFSPVLKAQNRVLTITYTLTISVARTAS